jgi:hypothetical protein
MNEAMWTETSHLIWIRVHPLELPESFASKWQPTSSRMVDAFFGRAPEYSAARFVALRE